MALAISTVNEDLTPMIFDQNASNREIKAALCLAINVTQNL
jgi:hypothetical protein